MPMAKKQGAGKRQNRRGLKPINDSLQVDASYQKHYLKNSLANKVQAPTLKSRKLAMDYTKRIVQSAGSIISSTLEKATTKKRFGPPSSMMFAKECPFQATSVTLALFANRRAWYNFKSKLTSIYYTHMYASQIPRQGSTLLVKESHKTDGQKGLGQSIPRLRKVINDRIQLVGAVLLLVRIGDLRQSLNWYGSSLAVEVLLGVFYIDRFNRAILFRERE